MGVDISRSTSGLRFLRTHIHFAQTGSLAAQRTQVEQLGATYMRRAHDFDLVDNFEFSGKMRSTPWPKLILRTIKLGWVPLLFEMTRPSNICTRSLSPSLIFTCTRTVSPDLNSGRSVRRVLAIKRSIIGEFDIFLFPSLSHASRRPESWSFSYQNCGNNYCRPAISSTILRSSLLSSAPRNKSGRLFNVFSSALRRRQRLISSWFPFTSTSGTGIPRNSAGRV